MRRATGLKAANNLQTAFQSPKEYSIFFSRSDFWIVPPKNDPTIAVTTKNDWSGTAPTKSATGRPTVHAMLRTTATAKRWKISTTV